ncbi:Arginine--pyruvate transaminase AruH [Pelagimonas phthalicica]|uniref:Aminotransferase n=1 Tax=Pelagimonas phthalicica TaxID=1037362 RepID=A0A238JD30_9RHOB|nr:pyridoxal phosphate-dependent aminotransferase [Pelagimonas phthalicica]TDS91561.1 arginine:pyruvate transaminase [Pelagimonas phthalicica]SMX28610.1 Arginine--pyruvate transaminase AruH [Pelagimonas phthalicica]
MAKLSDRITSITGGGSDGWEVFYRARRMVAAGETVTELTIGEHDVLTDETILDAMHRSAKGGHTGYAMVPGVAALRQAVADRLTKRTGVPTKPDNILITPGGQSALFSAHMAVCNPGDTALYVDPYYATYPGTIRAASAIPHAIETRSRDAFLPDPELVSETARAHKARSLLINSPNNPTGTVYPRTTLEGIAKACIDNDMWLISDEVYDTQIWQGDHLSPRALPSMVERTLMIGSFSKSHAMTGSRIGWIAAPEEVITKLIDLATSTTYGVPGYIQDAALFALQQGEPLEEKIAAPFRRRRDLMREILAEQSAVKAIPSNGAMYTMLDVRATGLSGLDFAQALLTKHKIAVMPGESFGNSAAGHVRVALTVADDKLSDSVRTLCQFAHDLSKETSCAS